MATEEVRIVVSIKGARKAKRDVDGVGNSSKRTAKKVRGLNRALGSLHSRFLSLAAAAASTGFVVKMGSDFQLLERRMQTLSGSTEELSGNMELLALVSRTTRTNINTNANAFQRLSLATKNVGGTTTEAAQVLTTLNQAFAIGGNAASEIAAATTQLGQALASGRLSGDELRSLTENASFLADALGDEIGGKGVASLRELSAQGKLTSDVLLDAFGKVAPKISEQFAKLPPTLGESLNVLRTEIALLGTELVPLIQKINAGLAKSAETLRILKDVRGAKLRREQLNQLAKGETATGLATAVEPIETFDVKKVLGRGIKVPRLETPEETNLRALQDALRVLPGLYEKAAEETRKYGEASESVADRIASFEKQQERANYLLNLGTEIQQQHTKSVLDNTDAGQQRALAEQAQADAATRNAKATSVMVEALEERLQKEKELTEEFAKQIDAINQKQFEKDIARYEKHQQVLTQVFSVAGDALLEFTRTGELNFREFGSAILDVLQRILIEALITQAVTSLLGDAPTKPGGFNPADFAIFPEFAGGYADGGMIPAGKFGLVGEQGPEFISGPANISPIPGTQQQSVEVIVRHDPGVILEVMRSEEGQRAQLENINNKKTATKRLLS